MNDTQREYEVDEALLQAERDNEAVDKFAQAMKEKLAIARAKGKSGWENKNTCSGSHLVDLFWQCTRKQNEGNFVDLANFLMFLHVRGEHPSKLLFSHPACNSCGNNLCFSIMHRFRDDLDLDILACKYWYAKEGQDGQ